MSAHESMEHAEHAEHASGSNKKIASLIAVIALFLALSETLGKGAQTEAISKNVEASNLWAFFQAKSIRRTVVQATAEHAKLGLGPIGDDAAKAALQKINSDLDTIASAAPTVKGDLGSQLKAANAAFKTQVQQIADSITSAQSLSAAATALASAGSTLSNAYQQAFANVQC